MSRDLRKYASQTNIRLVLGGILLIFVIGIGLIYLFYGQGAALTGLLCLVVGLIPLLLIWFMFWLLEFITKRVKSE
jgi:TM2 domain-containing membrane protein YozV